MFVSCLRFLYYHPSEVGGWRQKCLPDVDRILATQKWWDTWGAAVSFGMTWQERQVGASLLAKLKKNCPSLHFTASMLYPTRTLIYPDEKEHSKLESVLNLRVVLAPAAAR